MYRDLLSPQRVHDDVAAWLREDVPAFDVGGFVVGSDEVTAHLYQKASGVLAGVPWVDEVFRQLGCVVTWAPGVHEGESRTASGAHRVELATVRGPACAVLQGERCALNALARASGIASLCRALSEQARAAAWHGRVAGTRKTTPGFRAVEKYAMLVGGCDTHRYDLSAMVMLKGACDNHVHATGSIAASVRKARSACGFSVKIEVETSTLAAASEAVEAGADVVMLDNLEPAELHAVAAQLRARHPHTGYLVEASGGITEHTIKHYFGPHVDVISMGNITQGAPVVDFSLKILAGRK